MTPESRETILTSAPLHISRLSAETAFNHLKEINNNKNTLERAINEIGDFNPEFLDHIRKFKAIRLKLGLKENMKNNYNFGNLFGYLSVIQEYGNRKETLPRITRYNQDQYCLAHLRPMEATDQNTSYYKLFRDYATTQDMSMTDSLYQLTISNDKRYFASKSQTKFKENSKVKLEEFKKDEMFLADVVQNIIFPNTEAQNNEEFYLGSMDTVMLFRTRKADILIDSMLDEMSINL